MTMPGWFPATVYYSGDGYSTAGPKLMGRQAAGQGFLRAYVQAAQQQDQRASAWLTAHSRPAAQAAQLGFSSAGLTSTLEVLSPLNMSALSQSGCLYVPQPGLADLASQRLRVGERQFSLCGVTHTTASHAVMSTLAQLPLAPLRPWDAVICTSNAVLQSVNQLLDQQRQYLQWKLGATRLELPQLPVIPLGVHVQDYAFSDAQKHAARQQLGLGPNDVAVLFVGRLSFHAKAHPHPMLVALQNAAQQSAHKVHLIQAGWFANAAIEAAFKEAARVLAPDAQHHYLDGRDPEQRQTAWAGADIFCSLADNIQETFGLTPIEAMAAALPVVVTDWDGYKDTVRHGTDGFRVRTHMPAAGDGVDLATLYERGLDNYDMYCGKVCEFVSVDIAQATEHFVALVNSPQLRQRMGAAAQAHAQQTFDWTRIMQRYQALWHELSERRLNQADGAHGPVPLRNAPDRPDPYDLFSAYATQALTGTSLIQAVHPVDAACYLQIVGLSVHKYAAAVLPTWAQVQALMSPLTQNDCTVDQLIQGLKPSEQSRRRRHLLWMMKVGWLRTL